MKLSDLVYPDVNVARSVNLERDRGCSSALENYQITGKAREILGRFISALRGEKVSAWSLTGPYGMGKSAFANYLVAVTGNDALPETNLAHEKLRYVDHKLQQDLVDAISTSTDGKGFFRVPITATYEPVNRTLLSGLLRALGNGQLDLHWRTQLQNSISELQQLCQQEHPDSHTIAKSISVLHKKLYRPIIIVIDEFGKNLEYMVHHPDKGDIFVMQMLAEISGVYLWVCLHQSFEGYASGLTVQQRQEWNKVQGRFEDISFVESTPQMLALARRILVQRPEESRLAVKIQEWAATIAQQAKAAKLPSVESMTEDEIASLYPLHPVSAIVLTELCRRFAQNDRTLLSFLCSGDPYALPHYLLNHKVGTDERLPSLGLDYLYDYFFSVSTTTFINRPEAQRWVEIQDIIGQAHSLSPQSLAILKAVGVLNLISGPFGFPATPQVLRLALLEPLGIDQQTLDNEISDLSQKKVLIFRQYAQEYRLWEGSDFDIIGAIHEKRALLETRPLVETLQSYCPQVPIIASRHSYETGTVRRFECRWMAITDLIAAAPKPQRGYDGLLVYAFGNQTTIQELPPACADGRPILVAYTAHENQIRELILEAAAARAVFDEAPELVHDGVARKEARFRVQAAEDRLRSYVGEIYAPGSEDAQWYAFGELQKVRYYRDLSSLISSLCDQVFAQCPKIGNEMINYEQLSSAAARARRELGEAMVAREREENLGLTGYGPEVAIYRSLFRSTGLHRYTGGQWRFIRPDATLHPQLAAVWNVLDGMLDAAQDKHEGIDVRALIHRLKEPPFGMREGPIPLFLCHYLIVNADEIALYQERAFKPYFGEAEIALMVNRPELFSLRRYAPTGLRREVVQAYMQVLDTNVLQLDKNVRNPSLLRIVTPLVRFMEELPQYTRFTRRISLAAQKLRGAILNAREPIQLLFEEIPIALGISPVLKDGHPDRAWKEMLRDRLQEALLELHNAFDRLNIEVQQIIMEAFGFHAKTNTLQPFRKEMQKRISPLINPCQDKGLKSVLSAFINRCEDDAEWIRGIAGQTIKKPVDSWHDTDIEPFRASMLELSARIESLRELVAAGLGLGDDSNVVVTLTRGDGKTHRRVVRLDEVTRRKLRQNFSNIFSQSLDMRAALCALLSESLEEKK
ncbi:MAG: hypothetical protein AB1611_04585 [bacterium]